jgi:hypothetical protein
MLLWQTDAGCGVVDLQVASMAGVTFMRGIVSPHVRMELQHWALLGLNDQAIRHLLHFEMFDFVVDAHKTD